MPIDSHLIQKAMKKFLSSLLLLSAMLLTVVSCDKDDEPFSLKGKTYAAVGDWLEETLTGAEPAYRVWRFISDTEVEETIRAYSPTGKVSGGLDFGTYTLDYPILTVQIQLAEDYTKIYECEFIDEDTFRNYYYFGGAQQMYEFIKQ